MISSQARHWGSITNPKATSSSPHINVIKLFFTFIGTFRLAGSYPMTSNVNRFFVQQLNRNGFQSAKSINKHLLQKDYETRHQASNQRWHICRTLTAKADFRNFYLRGPDGSFFGKPTVQKSRGDNREKLSNSLRASQLSVIGDTRKVVLKLTDDTRTATK